MNVVKPPKSRGIGEKESWRDEHRPIRSVIFKKWDPRCGRSLAQLEGDDFVLRPEQCFILKASKDGSLTTLKGNLFYA